MFSPKLKSEIAEKVSKILRDTNHPELPDGTINFFLHVDGAESRSWANIRNNESDLQDYLPKSFVRNMSV